MPPPRRLRALTAHLATAPPLTRAPQPAAAAGAELSLQQMRDVWQKDLTESVMPFWMEHGPDEEHGGYFTCLDRTGEVYDENKYMWLQGRAVYTFARMFNEYETLHPPIPDGGTGQRRAKLDDMEKRLEYRRLAKLGAEFLEKGRGSDGINDDLLFFSLSRDGQYKLHLQRKPYSAVFFVQGCLEYYRALRTLEDELNVTSHGEDKETYLSTAIHFYNVLGDWLADPQLSGRPKVEKPPPDGTTALGDVMCMASLALDFLEKLPWGTGHPLATDERKEGLIASIRQTMQDVQRHYEPERRILLENVPEHGVDLSTPQGRFFNPGHSIEVAWFLLHMCEVVPDDALSELALNVLEGSLEMGWDEAYGGGILYMMDVLGKPMVDATVTKDGKLWWPVTEALYALTYAYTMTNEEKWLAWLRKVHTYAYTYFADPDGGGEWFGYLNRDGSRLHDVKGGNYKGCFHVPRALILCVQRADKFL